jgi:hypothetical protein
MAGIIHASRTIAAILTTLCQKVSGHPRRGAQIIRRINQSGQRRAVHYRGDPRFGGQRFEKRRAAG